jgi:hypothetical protein
MSGAVHGVLASLKSAAAAATDAFFKYVSLLLNTTATNGAQNNTFLDSSTNNFSITRNGDTTQGSFTPYMPDGYWGAYFDGAGDWLEVSDNASFDLAASDFTIETWVNFSSLPSASGAATFAAQWPSSGTTNLGYFFYIFNSAGTYQIYFSYSTTGTNQINLSVNLSTAPSIGVWNHIAAVRSGTNYLVFWNGTQVGSTQTLSATINNSSLNLTIGQISSGGSPVYSVNGYLSNWRLVKGTAVYTANFTPPTTPLTAITNTSLLACQSNRFIDNSSNAFAITRNGDTRISKFCPFSPPASWSAATYGGSGYFDGTGDWLNPGLNTALNPGTGDFTFECWAYATAAVGNSSIFEGTSNGLSITFNAGKLAVAYSGVSYLITDASNFPLNQWVHVAASRSGTTLSLFVNGSRVGTATNSTNFVSSTENRIGRDATTAYFTGYLSNLRIIKGTAVYDPTQTTLTVPTAPLTAITNTSLLLNFTNAGIYDASTINDGQTVGNAQVSTAQSKFGGSSMYFDGASYCVSPNTQNIELGGGDFTIELWLYVPGGFSASAKGVISKGTVGNSGDSAWSLESNGANLTFYGPPSLTTYFTTTSQPWTSGWTHIAITRSGSSSRLFVNGTQQGSTYGTLTTFATGGNIYVGTGWFAPTGRYMPAGYLQDVRITNGYARYTSNFTPPTAAFPTS